jgi:hypothetical protein
MSCDVRAGTSSTSPSTSTRGSRSGSPTARGRRNVRRLPRSCARLVPRTGHRRRSACSATMRAPTTRGPGGRSARATASAAASHVHTGRGRTARRRRSSRRSCARGPTLRLPHEQPSEPRPPPLPQVVQPSSTARLARRPSADQPRLKRLWSVHLELGRRRAPLGAERPRPPGRHLGEAHRAPVQCSCILRSRAAGWTCTAGARSALSVVAGSSSNLTLLGAESLQ